MKQTPKTQERIKKALQGLLTHPPSGDIKKLVNHNTQNLTNYSMHRLRVSDFRIIFYIDHDEEVVFIYSIGNRGDIY